ncbi:MAG: hypothetical protein FWD13_13295 [Treponema sp.]|nr:hypothetical protein [Treponema sp.]
MKKLILVLILIISITGISSAVDLLSFPGAIKPGDTIVNVGFTFGHDFLSGPCFGVTGSADYALDINFPLTVGGETGIVFTPVRSSGYESMVIIPFMGRAAWHPDIELENVDLYAMVKLGFAIGFITNPRPDSVYSMAGGFCFAGIIGGRYFLSETIGLFAEVGYEQYYLPFTDTFQGVPLARYTITARFLTLGLTFRITND